MSGLIKAIEAFPYWPVLITAATSMGIAIYTAKKTMQVEISKVYRAQQNGSYDALRSFIDELEVNPGYLLSQDYSARRIKVENHLRSFASPEVMKASDQLLSQLEKRRSAYADGIKELDKKYTYWEPLYDEEGKLVDYDFRLAIDPDLYERELNELFNRYSAQEEELRELAKPVLDAIRKSMSSDDSTSLAVRLHSLFSSLSSQEDSNE